MSEPIDLPDAGSAYVSPQSAAESGQPPPEPKGLTTIAVLCLVLAGLGLMTGASGVAMAFLGPAMQQSIIDSSRGSEEPSDQMQVEIQEAAQQVSQKYKVPGIVASGLSALACLGMLVGSVLVLRKSPSGRQILLWACLAVIATDIGKAVIQGMSQREAMQAMGDTMPQMLANDPDIQKTGNAENVQQAMGTMMNVIQIVMVVLLAGWCLVKVAFYLYSASRLSRPQTVAYFEHLRQAHP